MSDDVELLDAWRTGARRAGEQLVARYTPTVWRFFAGKISAQEADDLTQVTMMAFVDAKERFEGRGSVRAFVLRIARNKLIDHLRRAFRQPEFKPGITSLSALGTTPSQHAAREERRFVIERAVRCLPLDQQLTLELFYWEGLTTDEVAQVLEVAQGTIKARLSRGRKRLAEILAEQGATELGDEFLEGA